MSVIPEGFTVGVEHNHVGEVGLPETAKLTAAIKRKATRSRLPLTSRALCGSQSGGVVSGVCLPLEQGPLEKSSRARPSDYLYERLDYEWLHQATDGTTLPSAWDHCCNLWQPKTRGQDGAFIAVHQLRWGKLDLQQSLAPKCWSVFMQSIRTNNNIEGWHHSLNRRVAGWCGLPFYMSVALLHKEARLVLQQIRLVSKCKRKWSAERSLNFGRPSTRRRSHWGSCSKDMPIQTDQWCTELNWT